VVQRKRRAGASQSGLDLVGDEQRVAVVADLTDLGEVYVGGTTPPASPWIGSSRTAAEFSVIPARSASMSPYGTTLKPGVNGPNSWRALESVENEMMVVVRPWKFAPATTISAAPSGTPLTW
jgi:hypothetical protein